MAMESTRAGKMVSQQEQDRVAQTPSSSFNSNESKQSTPTFEGSRSSSPTRSLKRKAPTPNPPSRIPLPFDHPIAPLRPRPPLLSSKSFQQVSKAHESSDAEVSPSREIEDLMRPGGLLTAENLRHRSKSFSHYSTTTVSETRSDSTILSISKFPRPPSGVSTVVGSSQRPVEERLPSTVYSPPSSRTQHGSPNTIFHRGTSFDIVNPHLSLDISRLNALQRLNQSSEDNASGMEEDLASPLETPNRRVETPSIDSAKSGKETPPSRAIFEDLPTAHSSILRVTNAHWRLSPSGSPSDIGSPHPRALNVRKQSPTTENLPVAPSPALLRSRPSDVPLVENTNISISTENRAPSPTWKDMFSNVFRRRENSPTASERKDDDLAPGLHPRPPSRKKDPFTAMPDSQPPIPSQSLPVLTSKPSNTSKIPVPISEKESQLPQHQISTPGALQTYQEQADRLTRQALFASRAVPALPLESDQATSFKADARSTVGSILKSYGDEYIDADAFKNSGLAITEKTTSEYGEFMERSKSERVASRFSQFDFGITEADERSMKSSSPHVVGSSPITNQSQSTGQASGFLLRPHPTPESAGAVSMQRSRSSPSEQSHGSFFNDPRDIFGLLPRGQSFATSEGNSSGKASSGALADLDDKEINAGSRASTGPVPRLPPSGLSHKSSAHSQNRSRPTSESLRAAGLEREISRELRRISQISGVSRLSGTVFVLNEDRISASSIDDRGNRSDEENTHDHGGFQTSSSDNILDRAANLDLDIGQNRDSLSAPQRSKSRRGKGRATSGSRSSRGSSQAKTNSFRSQLNDEDVVDAGDDEDKEWETVHGSRAFDRGRFEPEHTMIREMTGSSLANLSDNGEVAAQDRNSFSKSPVRQGPLSPVSEVLQHSADQRFQHVYRMREVGPEHESILIPSYSFSSNSRFPNRNALSPPLSSEFFEDKTYRHPLPLSRDHVNPFKSSPPLVSSPPRKEIGSSHDNGTNVRDFSKASETETTPGPEIRRRDSSGRTALDRSFSSSVWMDTFGEIGEIGEIGSDLGDEPDLPSGNGSFAKTTTLGPKANITGSPHGTNMRQVGSSLADKSSPGPPWTSSPNYPLSSSPAHHGASRLFQGSSLTSPKSAHLRQNSRGEPSDSQSGALYDQIRAHREQLAAEGLLPRPFSPATPKETTSHRRQRSLFGGSFRTAPDVEHGFPESEEQPTSYLPTPPIPRVGLKRPLVYSQAHLRRHPRFDSDTGLALSRRKQHLSRIVLSLCLLFPPMLLVYGYGGMDSLMVSLSYGEITRFGSTEKRAALVLGYGLAISAVIGIIVGMIVVGLSK